MDSGKAVAGAAVDCAIVCCCCPFGLANLLIMAMVKLPVHLCRETLRKMKKKMKKKNSKIGGSAVNDEDDPTAAPPDAAELLFWRERSWEAKEAEIWEPFYGTGFWRTLSREKTTTSPLY